jgi:threonine dehydratase
VNGAVESLPISADDVVAAGRHLFGIAHRTPVASSRTLDEITGQSVYLKCENQQRTGSFKFRGAFNTVLQLTEEQRARGVITTSSGNHAQGLALAAHLLRTPATILMPTDAPTVKVEATLSYGATVTLFDRQRLDAEVHGRSEAERLGMTFVPAFDHPHVIAGQGTAAMELLEDVPPLDALVIPVGGGGIAAGSAVIAKHLHPGIAIFGVETVGADDTKRSFDLGHRVVIDPPTTIADGIRLRTPGALTFPVLQELLEDVLVVTDDEVRDALRFLVTRMKLVVEPSGAVPVAALARRLVPARYRRVGVIITGGNIDPHLLSQLWAPTAPAKVAPTRG